MSDTPVSLKFKSDVRLPQTVVLPQRLHRLLGVDRHFVIAKPNQEVPQGVADWLRGDPRYSAWFAEAMPSAEAVTLSAPTTKTEPQSPPAPPADDAPTGDQTPEKTDDDAPPQTPAPTVIEDGWSADWTVPQLRDYAAKHDVALTNDDLKADVIDKIRAARPDFEIKEASEE